jgi:C4-dicarboxylate-specific signal transduction histidine kinase
MPSINEPSEPQANQAGHRQQRLLAVGRLTEGIAHDINNALTIVLWNLERLLRSHSATSKEAEVVRVAMDAATNGASLLQLLLEYSGHESHDPDLVHLGELLERMAPILTTLIDSKVGIDCHRVEKVGPVTVDATWLELSLLELAVALSQTMTSGGSLVFDAADAAVDESAASKKPEVLLSLRGTGIAVGRAAPIPEATFLQACADLAGGRIEIAQPADGVWEMRLYLPRATQAPGDTTVIF